jgi:hypothetical protein
MNLSPLSFFKEIQSFFSQAETPITDSTWQEIPEAVKTQLNQILSELPPPSSSITAIQKEIFARLKDWETVQEANHLVILGSPMSNLASLISASFPHHCIKEVEVIYPFSKFTFREQPSQMTQQLKIAIEKITQKEESPIFQPSQQRKNKVIIIPALEQCFLRCIGGWEGMIWLREQIVKTPHCFWLLGCNQWSWIFLNYVCQMNAYLEASVTIPDLNGNELGEWLKPVTDSFIPETKEEKSSVFWRTLASLSEGNSQVAMQLWLQSIQMSIETGEEEEPITRLKLITPSLEKLPTLSADDRYVLHSLLLHGRMKSTRFNDCC